jgi:hypothetical protein
LVHAPVLEEARFRYGLAGDLRGWLEGTDGDGFLDAGALV